MPTSKSHKKSLTACLSVAVVAIALGQAGKADQQQASLEQQEYCARVVAGVHTDFDGLCPAGAYNSYRGLPGDVACVGDGTCSSGPAIQCDSADECGDEG